MRTQINGVDVSPNDNMYAYKAFMSHVLTTTKSANQNYFKHFEGWELDAPIAQYGAVVKANNTGLAARITKFSSNTDVRLLVRITDAIWCQEKALPPGFAIRVQFDRNPEAFTLMRDGDVPADPELHVHEAIMHLKTAELMSTISEQHKHMLDSADGISLDMKYGQARLIEVPAAMTTYNVVNVYTGTLPAYIVIGLVQAEHYNGTLDSNPLHFKNFHLDRIKIGVNGHTWHDYPVELDTNASDYLRAYRVFRDQTGFLHPDGGGESIDVTPVLWASCLNLFPFQISPYAAKQDVLPEIGRIEVELHFRVATPHVLNMVFLAQKNA